MSVAYCLTYIWLFYEGLLVEIKIPFASAPIERRLSTLDRPIKCHGLFWLLRLILYLDFYCVDRVGQAVKKFSSVNAHSGKFALCLE